MLQGPSHVMKPECHQAMMQLLRKEVFQTGLIFFQKVWDCSTVMSYTVKVYYTYNLYLKCSPEYCVPASGWTCKRKLALEAILALRFLSLHLLPRFLSSVASLTLVPHHILPPHMLNSIWVKSSWNWSLAPN